MTLAERIKLSEREREVLNLKMEGFANKEIAVQLKISERTVKTHITHMLERLNCRNVLQLCCMILREELNAAL